MAGLSADRVLAVTGAAGFIGREVVAVARAEGYAVRAILRDTTSAPAFWQDDPLISVHVVDLGANDATLRLQPALAGAVAVIHLAGAMDGDDTSHERDTLGGTRHLLSALAGLPMPRAKLVLASSLAVYDAFAVPVGGVLDEAAPLEQEPEERDAYCRAKLAQERLVRDSGLEAVILRPGAVVGPGRDWNGHQGVRLGRVLITTGPDGQVPLVSVETCADAFVQAVHMKPGTVVNVLDRDLPDRRRHIKELRRDGRIGPVVAMPWRLAAPVVDTLALIPALSRHLPGLLRPRILRARLMPRRYRANCSPGDTGDAGMRHKCASYRIAYLTGEYPRATDTFIQREVAGLRRNGFEVLTCSVRRTGPEHLVGDEQRREAAGTFHVLEAARAPLRLIGAHLAALVASPRRYVRALRLAICTRPPGLRALIFQLFYFAEAVVLARHMAANGVVHLHNHIAKSSATVAMLASEVSGIPFSFTLHGPDIFFEPHYWRLDEKIARAAFVACISDFCRSQAMVFSDRQHWDKLHVVHCGVEPGRYAAPPTARRGQRILFVGRLAAVKGLPVLFGALARLRCDFPDLAVTLIGDGPERPALEGEAAALGLSGMIEFAGYKGQSEVAAALAASDLLVLPSFAEGLPVVLMEALAAGLPVVATRIAGVAELVEDGISGFLVAPGDEAALADKLAILLADPARRRAMGKAGRAKVRAEFDIAQESAWLGDILRASITGAPRPPKRPAARPDAWREAGE
ncbi:MAG: glycosyltransferase [Rhodobacteraceae bacterium]|nr:glycosyltransferase [Paracoccaceae bacterium]